jgi:hypothetical protein
MFTTVFLFGTGSFLMTAVSYVLGLVGMLRNVSGVGQALKSLF